MYVSVDLKHNQFLHKNMQLISIDNQAIFWGKHHHYIL